MAEIRLNIPDNVIADIQKKLGSDVKATDIAKDAVTLFNWAATERAQGNYILSSDPEGEKVTRLAMPSLEQAAVKK
jgi:hypothetical protein